ncbi:gamma-glutamyltransferase, partial [Escherichia coli]|nr:gamma-glutamyltransferase [Escherichia coli]
VTTKRIGKSILEKTLTRWPVFVDHFNELRVEKGFSPDTIKLLEAKGQKVALKEAMGSTQSIMVGPDGELYGASDPRSVDDLTAGY